jgi:hypothetical protein
MYRISILLFFITFNVFSQDNLPAKLVTCTYKEENAFSEIRDNLDKNLRFAAPTATIEVTYNDFPANAKTAFDYAASLWAKAINSSQPIRIEATWKSLSGNTLAQSGTTQISKNFTNAPYSNVWYPIALAEAISRRELNRTDIKYEIQVNLNSNVNWYLGTDAKAQAGRFDLVTVALHEIAHGLGFTSTFEVIQNNTQGQWGTSGSAYIYDLFVLDNQNKQLTSTVNYSNPSTGLKNVLTGGALFFGLKEPKFKNALPKLHAPATFADGGSISHFDEATYPVGNPNSLMSPNIRAAEVNHNIGEVLLFSMMEMGWFVNGVTSALVTSNEDYIKETEVIVFPNPVDEKLFIAIPNKSPRDISIQLLNLKGQIIQSIEQKNIQSMTYELNISDLAEGFYIVRIMDGTKVINRKIVKN